MRDLFIVEQNNVIRYDDVSLSHLQEALEASKGLFWLDLEQITDEDASFLCDFQEISAHPLSVKACREDSTRQASAVFPRHMFFIIHIQESLDAPEVKLGCFLAPNYLVTIHPTPLSLLQDVKDQIHQDAQLMRSTDEIVALIMQILSDRQGPVVTDLIAEKLDFDQGVEPLWLYNEQRQLIKMLHLLKQQSEIVHSLYNGEKLSLQADTVVQLQDVYYKLRGMIEVLTRHWEMLNDASTVVHTKILKKLDLSTRRLSILVAVLLPVLVFSTLIGINGSLLTKLINPIIWGIGLVVTASVAVILIMTGKTR